MVYTVLFIIFVTLAVRQLRRMKGRALEEITMHLSASGMDEATRRKTLRRMKRDSSIGVLLEWYYMKQDEKEGIS